MNERFDGRGERTSSSWLHRMIERFERRIFLDDDVRALARGWQVSVGPGGRGRQYRDVRWDTVSVCADCTGTGAIGARPCGCCGGAGTVRTGPERERAVAS